MAKDLERDLGLLSVMAISIGAMVGSGIFILPALAVKDAGAGMVLAFAIAGVLVVPAALSKAEMATAMPEAGGTYIYIERSMGPLLGSVAGVGTWFALAFKGALALVGGVPYLLLVLDLPPVFGLRPTTWFALALALVLVGVNLLGAKQTGRLQVAIVAAMLAAMAWFAVGGVPASEFAGADALLAEGASGIFAATGLVFVSFAGVTKIASVAEEVEDPDRVIPLGMLGSLTFTTLLYVLVVAVVVGVLPLESIAAETTADAGTPIADAAEVALGPAGVAAVVGAAVLALVSTANAGVLSASRYPFAMSRDGLVPASLGEISDRFDTPATAISLTGAVMLVLIAFVPILEIAKLASAFQILVFAIINVAVIAFRESDAADYDPSFESPLYPYVQVFGFLTGLALLTQMGTVAILGAVVIVGGSVAWYGLYVRPRVDRQSAVRSAARRTAGERVVERTREALAGRTGMTVLVALPEDADERAERALLRVADAVVGPDGTVVVAQFDKVPDQQPLRYAIGHQSPADVEFERRTDELAEAFEATVEYGEIVSHDPKRAVVNAAADIGVDLLLIDHQQGFGGYRLFSDSGDWIERNAPCDTVGVALDPGADPDRVTLVATQGPYDPLKVRIGNALAVTNDAELRLVYSLAADTADEQRDALQAYHEELVSLSDVPTSSQFVDPGEIESALASPSGSELVLLSRKQGLLTSTSDAGDRTRIAVEQGEHGLIELYPARERASLVSRLRERAAF